MWFGQQGPSEIRRDHRHNRHAAGNVDRPIALILEGERRCFGHRLGFPIGTPLG
jgi:hypothetical protein